ncbi:MAG: hypothetical protein NTW87_08095 [Planctomycetota bacterium]|nr:hypothetical protein [Planctomycetota bacterium]
MAALRRSRVFFFVLLFAVAWGVMVLISPSKPESTAVPADPGLWPFAVAIAPWLLVFAVAYGLFQWQVRRALATVQRNRDANALLDAGDLASAISLYDQLLKECPRNFMSINVLVYDRALALFRQGRQDEALEAFKDLTARKLRRNEAMLAPLVHFQLALCYALNGELVAAEEHHTRAHEMGSVQVAGFLTLVVTVIGLRQGRHQAVLKDLGQEWARVEGMLGVHLARVLRLLSAFGHSQLPDAQAHAEHIQQMLAGVRPFRPGEFDYLVINWPEFRAFLVEQGFVAAKAT